MQSADDSMLTELGKRLVGESLSDATLQRATEDTPDFAILPWVNVVKIGGQSIMDRGRSAVMPLIDEIVDNLITAQNDPRHRCRNSRAAYLQPQRPQTGAIKRCAGR